MQSSAAVEGDLEQPEPQVAELADLHETPSDSVPPQLRQALVQHWHALRATGVPAGAQTREMSTLRRTLLDAGLWREVYSP